MVSTISISTPLCYLYVGLQPLRDGSLLEAESLGAGGSVVGGLEVLLQKGV